MIMRVLVADDHDLLRDVLGSCLESKGGFEMHLACDVAGALMLIAATGPFDVTLLDFSMPGMNGYQGLKQVMAASEGRPVAIMTGTLPVGAWIGRWKRARPDSCQRRYRRDPS